MARIVSGPQITGQVRNKQTGSSIGPVTVTVNQTVYTDAEFTTGTTTLTTDGMGRFSCYAEPGTYTFTSSEPLVGPIESVEVLSPDMGAHSGSGRFLTSTEASAAYKPLTGHSQFVGYIGDSRMNRGSNSTTYRLGFDFMSQACVRSKQAIRYGSKQGVDGDTTAQMLARLPGLLTTTTVDGSGFAGCGAIVVLGGTNDWGNIAASAITMAAVKANIVAMATAIKAAGKLPVLCTETPRTAASGYQGYVDDFNSWITYYAAVNGLPLVDLFSVLVNPSNGQLAAAYDSGDNIHPNAVGMGVMADAVSAVLTRELHTSPLWLPGRSGDSQDLLAGAGLFLTNTGGLGTGWSNFSGGTAPTLTTPAATLGNWQQIDRASAATGNALLQWSTGSGFTIGQTYVAVGRIQTTGIAAGGSNVTVQVTYNGNAAEADPVYLWTNDIPDGVFAIPFTIPTGVTTVKLSLQVGASPSGAVMARISQAGIRNLTAEGF